MDVEKTVNYFSESDFKILESYKVTLDGLADYLGEGYELVLHSLHDLNHSVIKIINGHYTGRREGSPITDLALNMLEKIRSYESRDYISYFNKNKKGEPLKAATVAIRGENNRIIGLLCINFYLNTPMQQVLNSFAPQVKVPEENGISETLVDNVNDLIKESVDEVGYEVRNDASISAINKNKEIVYRLYAKGIFNLKDAVPKVADNMQISKNTVYLHVRTLLNSENRKTETGFGEML